MRILGIDLKVFRIFKLPKIYVYIGKLRYGSPYFYPWYYCPTIITRERRLFRCLCGIKMFGHQYFIGTPIIFKCLHLGWKDKYGTPRHEWNPALYLYFFKFQICVWFGCEDYWEQILWFCNYCDCDIEKTISTWGWRDMQGKSTWNNIYLK